RGPVLPHRLPELPGRTGRLDRLPDDPHAGRGLRRALPPDPKGTHLMTHLAGTATAFSRPATGRPPDRGRWLRFLILLTITCVVLVPIAVVLFLSLRPGVASGSHASF